MAETKKRTYTRKTADKAKTENMTAMEEALADTAAEAVSDVPAEEKQEKVQAPAAMFTEEQVQAMVAEAVAKAMANLPQQTVQPQIVQIAADVEKVHFLWMAQVSDDNVLSIGGAGSGYAPITGKYGEFVIPKSDLSRVMDGQFREWMRRRWLIVVDGMNEEERAIYGVAYKDGELMDRMAFTRMVELEDKIIDIYPKLCPGHREMIAKAYYEAYMSKDKHVRRDVVTRLNDMSIELGSEYGDFDAILEAMNEADRRRRK